MLSLVLASLSGIGSAFVGHTLYPWKGGVIVTEPVVSKPEPTPAPAPSEPADLESQIKKQFGNVATAKVITEFIQTPVMEWQKIAPTFRELVKKYSETMTHPDQNKCPPKLLKLCNLVSVKFSRIRDFIRSETPDSLGDQTLEAMDILKSTE